MRMALRKVFNAAFFLAILMTITRPSISSAASGSGPKFEIAFPRERSAQPLDGRLLLLLSTDPSEEPRMQIDISPNTQMVFGIDVNGLAPDRAVVVVPLAYGYPLQSLRDVAP